MNTNLIKFETSLNKLRISQDLGETGRALDFELTYETFGQDLHTAPLVLVNHALTGNSTVCGPKGWWQDLIGKNQCIDLNKYCVLAFNIPGNQYQNPEESLPLPYHQLSCQLIAELFWKGLEQLGVSEVFAVIGGSLGGGLAWEMAFQKPKAIEHLIPIATHLKASEWLKGQTFLQDYLLNQTENPIAIARMHAMFLYRTPESIEDKFATAPVGRQVEDWLAYHGKTLKNRFSLQAYQVCNHLLGSIGKHLHPKQIEEFAQQTTTEIHCIAVDSDLLFTYKEQEKSYQNLKTLGANIHLETIQSIHGHDAFLIEYKQLQNLLNPIFKSSQS